MKLDPLRKGLQRTVGRAPAPGSAPEFEPARSCGGLWVLHQLRVVLRSSRWQFDAEVLIRLTVFNRPSEPDSKRGVLGWREQVLVPELDTEGKTRDQLLRRMYGFFDHQGAAEVAVASAAPPLSNWNCSNTRRSRFPKTRRLSVLCHFRAPSARLVRDLRH